MIDTHAYKSTRDQKINDLKSHLPKVLEDLNSLCKTCISYCKNSNYADNDLRKTIFAKLYLFLVNFAIHCELIIEEKHLSKIINKWGLTSVPADYLENFLKFEMRSLYSEFIEGAEHLLALVLESWGKKNNYKMFSWILDKLEEEGVLSPDDRKFLGDWMAKERNPRHRNFYRKDGYAIEYKFPHNFSNFDELIDVIKKVISHPKIETIHLVVDKNPR